MDFLDFENVIIANLCVLGCREMQCSISLNVMCVLLGWCFTSSHGQQRLDDQLLIDAAQVGGEFFALFVAIYVTLCDCDFFFCGGWEGDLIS